MSRRSFEAALRDPRSYQRQLERLHARHVGTGQLYRLAQDGVPLAAMILDRRRVARRLAATVGSGRYRPAAATRRTIQAGRKEREVYVYPLVDRIVLGTVAGLIDAAATEVRSSRLYSYRAGTSSWSAVADLAGFVRAERRWVADPTQRWLYLLRRDVTSYTDSIPTGPEAPLWSMVREVVGPLRGPARDLVELTIRPEVLDRGRLTHPERGLPLGQPISGVIANLYLQDLDAALESVDGAFYARYGDDMVFAHPDAGVVREAAATIDRQVGYLGLSANADKDQNFVLTGAGRPSPHWPEARPATGVTFLGAEVKANGTVALNRDKARRFVRDVGARARRTNRVMADADEDARGRAVCAAVNATIDPRAALSHQSTATSLVRRVVTDRGQLADLDHRIAKAVIHALTGRDDVRAMRRLPIRRLREDWGLISLEHARNRHGRSA